MSLPNLANHALPAPLTIAPAVVSPDPFPVVSAVEIAEWADSGVYESFGASLGPEVCASLLARPLVQIRQRAVRASHVLRLARDMASGAWSDRNGQSIVFAAGGDLFDGRHRLTAAVRAGFRLRTIVVVGADPSSFGTVDTGLVRTDSHILEIASEENTSCLAAAAKIVWRLRADPSLYEEKETPGKASIVAIVRSFPGLGDSISATSDRSFRAMASASVLAASHYVLSGIDRDAAAEFFRQVRSGANLPEDSPILRLRNQMVSRREGKNVGRQEEQLAWIFKGWNYWRAGRSMRLLSWKKGVELFPIPL